MSNEARPVVRVAGVNDEASPTWDLDEGLDVLDELGIKFVELRAAHGQMVDAMDEETFARVAGRVCERGFHITTYLSQLGQCVPDDGNRAVEVARMRRAVQRTDATQTRLIRIMGYKRVEDGTDWNARATALFDELTAIAAAVDKVLVFENPPNASAAIATAPQCLTLLQAIDSPHLRLNLDPGNFGAHGEDARAAFVLLKDWVGNVHVKDIGVAGDQSTYCIAGEGVCGYPEIFRGLAQMNYGGFVTAEPHLSHAKSHHTSGRAGFMRAATRMIELLEQAGFETVRRVAT